MGGRGASSGMTKNAMKRGAKRTGLTYKGSINAGVLSNPWEVWDGDHASSVVRNGRATIMHNRISSGVSYRRSSAKLNGNKAPKERNFLPYVKTFHNKSEIKKYAKEIGDDYNNLVRIWSRRTGKK